MENDLPAPNPPATNNIEAYLAMLSGVEDLPMPETIDNNVEYYLRYLVENGGGGGGGGTTNYNQLSNKPKINSTTLSGNKSLDDLGIQAKIDASHKLSADNVDDTSTSNKFVTASDKNAWNAKQDAIDSSHKLSADNVDDTSTTNKFVTASDKTTWSGKQDSLVSGTNIKTINNQSLLGSGNIDVSGGGGESLIYENGIEKQENVVLLPATNDVTFAVTDLEGNSVFIVDNDGNADFNLSEALKRKIRSIDNYEFEADVYMVPCVGQSLAMGTGGGATTFSSTEPLSYNTSLENVNIQDMNSGFCEAFRIAASHYNVSLPSDFKIITCKVGANGNSINTFGKGGSHYAAFIAAVRTAKTACDNAGLTLCVPGFMWTQGEEDMRCGGTPSNYGSGQWNPFDYHTKLRDIIDNLNTDVKAITGQTVDVHCFSYQLSTHTAYRRYPRIGLELSKLAELDDRMLLSKIMYDVNYNADKVHAPNGTYRNMGNMYGLACFTRCVLQRDFKWVHPTKFDLQGSVMYIDFEVPVKPLTLDTTLVDNLEDGNYGFNIYNVPNEILTSETVQGITEATTRITNVELVSNSKIKLTFSRVPVAGERLTYGINGTGWQNITGYQVVDVGYDSGHISGPRGCLRDSSPIKNNNTGVTLPNLYDWCVIFEYKFEGGE